MSQNPAKPDTDALWGAHCRVSRADMVGIQTLMLRGAGWPKSIAEETAEWIATVAEEAMAEAAAKALN